VPQHIVFRLADSLPRALWERWADELRLLNETERNAELRNRLQATLDRGYGSCRLRRPEVARVIEEALLYFDGARYRLHGWCVMPNHVHVIATPLNGRSLSSIVHSWKSFTAKAANKILDQQGAFWQEEYFDRAIRNEKDFLETMRYVAGNPVEAGLCEAEEEWPFGHAGHGDDWRWGREVVDEKTLTVREG